MKFVIDLGWGINIFSIQVILGKVLRNEKLVKRWLDTEILIIDEISMLSLRTFEIIHFAAEGVRKSKRPLGGIQIVVCRDFKQLPPITNALDPGRYRFESEIWEAHYHTSCFSARL